MPVMTIKPGKHDPVKKPGHYTYGRYECIDIIEDILADAGGPEAFLIGNAIKYLWRFQHKNGTEDLEKARWYLDRAITRRRTMDGTRADTAIIDVAPGTVPIRNNRPVFGETTTWAAARLTGQDGEFFDAPDGTQRRTKGMLVKVENGLPAPYIARILLKEPGPGGIPRYVTMPYKYFSPLAPEPENGRPVFNRAVAEGAARYIGMEGEFFDKLDGIRKRGILRMITGPACDFRFNASLAEGGRGIYAFFSPLNPELQETGADENEQEKPDA